jgi:4-amino-4-deoxy-L-arabinose transferase-like glycosyltransferase
VSARPPAKVLLPALIAALFVASLLLARAFPLIDPDEGRNAEVAREMLESGDFVVPHLAGMPYLDKPPALFWATALSIAAFGRTPLAARLPAALAAAACLGVLAWLALRQRGPAFAIRAVLLLAAAPLFAALSAYVIFDLALALCVTCVWVGLADELDASPSRARRAAMFAAVTLGVLLKGPVMIAWVLGGSAAAAALMRSRSPLRWLAWWPGWAMVAGLAGGWFALASLRFPEYPHFAFLEESLERMTTGAFHREQPWWFAPAVLVAGALPWSLATPWAERRVRGPDERSDRSAHVALGFVLFAAVFFSLSRSKLVTYLVPALPPLAWLAASAWSDERPQRRAGWVLFALYAALAVAFGILGANVITFVPPGPSAAEIAGYRVAAAAFGACAALALAGALTRQANLAFAAALAFTPILLGPGRPGILPEAFLPSGAPLAAALAAASPRGTVRYERCYSPGTDFLLGRPSELVSETGSESTSNYQLRYRETLRRRGQWTAFDAPPRDGRAAFIVRPLRAAGAPVPAGWVEFFRDRRFVAYRR